MTTRSKRIGKNKNKNKKAKQSAEQNLQRQENVIALQLDPQQKCYNEFCIYKTEPYQKTKSRKTGSQLNFCQTCYVQYKKDVCCYHCEQIYFEHDQEYLDNKQWIGCDSCDKWYHTECIELYEIKNIKQKCEIEGFQFNCQLCTKKTQIIDKEEKWLMEQKKKTRRVQQQRTYKRNAINIDNMVLNATISIENKINVKIKLNQNEIDRQIKVFREIVNQANQKQEQKSNDDEKIVDENEVFNE